LRLLRFLRTFYFACVFLRKTLRAFEWKPGMRPAKSVALSTLLKQLICIS